MNQLLSAVKGAENVDVPTWMVVVLGISTVFIVLIFIIGICKLLGALMKRTEKQVAIKESAPTEAPAEQIIPNKGEFVAAVSAAIAEELGTDVSAIRIHDIKKL